MKSFRAREESFIFSARCGIYGFTFFHLIISALKIFFCCCCCCWRQEEEVNKMRVVRFLRVFLLWNGLWVSSLISLFECNESLLLSDKLCWINHAERVYNSPAPNLSIKWSSNWKLTREVLNNSVSSLQTPLEQWSQDLSMSSGGA
jgi:hypothetical protein